MTILKALSSVSEIARCNVNLLPELAQRGIFRTLGLVAVYSLRFNVTGNQRNVAIVLILHQTERLLIQYKKCSFFRVIRLVEYIEFRFRFLKEIRAKN